jgi:hypothetical protein
VIFWKIRLVIDFLVMINKWVVIFYGIKIVVI